MSILIAVVFAGSQVFLQPTLAIPIGDESGIENTNRIELSARMEVMGVDKQNFSGQLLEVSAGAYLGTKTEEFGVEREFSLSGDTKRFYPDGRWKWSVETGK